MKKLLPFVLLLVFLVACADEFPPSPPPPGEQQLAGMAYGGIPISPGSLPKWAAEIKYTDIDPTQVKEGDTVKVVVKKPDSVKTRFYVHAISYAYNKKFKFWEKVFANTQQSGKIVKTWAEDKATFLVPISTDRFLPGPNYVVIYWCIDTEKRDDKGFKIWDCQGKKWQLGAFEMLGAKYPDILIEKDIENNRYKSSSKTETTGGDMAGTLYTASYETLTGVKTDVSVLKVKNMDNFMKELTETGTATLETLWAKRGNVCGFLEASAGKVMFGWLSGTNWLTVTTYANTADDAKIGVYGIKYPSDCGLLDKLKGIVPITNLCGNNAVDAPEECDGSSDSACPGACRPDCTCMATGDANFGFCGDNIIQKPNKDGVTEDCEPPGTRDPVTGQLVSSACFLRNALGQVTGTGACDDKCKCIAGTFTKSSCGDGRADAGEQCGDPGTPGCPIGSMCVNCKCWAVPLTCGNGVKDAGEQCDPGKPGVACPAGQTCSGNCLCVKKSKCGNGKVEPGEQCEKAADCPNGLPGTFKACLACGCAYFGAPMGGCGDNFVDKPAGEECEKDQDCANPPGGTASPTCNKNTCKCNRICGDAKINAPNDEVPPKNEECDPPGRPGICPPMQMPGGGCAIPLCQNDCTCPVGQSCEILSRALDILYIEVLPTSPLHIDEPLGAVIETVVDDMWAFLLDGQIGPTKYHQYLRVADPGLPSGKVILGQNELDQQGHFLFFKDGLVMFEFEIGFEEGLDSSVVDGKLVDLEGKTMTLFKEPYRISEAKVSSSSGEIKIMFDGPSQIVLSDLNYGDALFSAGGAEVNHEPIEDAEVRMRGAMLPDGRFELSDIRYRLKADGKLGDVYVPVGGSLREQLDEPQGLLGPWDIFLESVQGNIAKVYLGPQRPPSGFTQECSDTDGGWNLLARGLVTMTGMLRCTDRCATSQELQTSQGRDQLFECFCGDKQGFGGGQGSGWTSCPDGTSCQNGACVPLTMSSSMSAIVVEGTSGCVASSRAGCYEYLDGATRKESCNGCLNACCVTYSCTDSGSLVESSSPAGCKTTATACTDSDAGKSYFVKGEVRQDSTVQSDTCAVSSAETYQNAASCVPPNCYVLERFCDGTPNVEPYQCPFGCNNGACTIPNINIDIPRIGGWAVSDGEIAGTKGIQIALFLVAAMGILVITLLNFVHRE